MNSQDPTVLFSFAHPDDETFCGMGLALACRARGARVTLVTATLGQAGKRGDPEVCSHEQLPAQREMELRAAAAIGGFAEVRVLGHEDRVLAGVPVSEIRGQLVAAIRKDRPAVVLTFDPNGFNLHPDHIAISRFTSDAIAAAADPRWFPEAGPPHRVQRLLWTSPLAPWEAARASDVVNQPGVDFVVDVSAWREEKRAALRAHRTQHLSIDRYFLAQPDLDRLLALETYRHAWGPALSKRPADDVLEGIT